MKHKFKFLLIVIPLFLACTGPAPSGAALVQPHPGNGSIPAQGSPPEVGHGGLSGEPIRLPVIVVPQICRAMGALDQRCCTGDLKPTWWCNSNSLREPGEACSVTYQSGQVETGSVFVCDRPVNGDVPNRLQAALIRGNSLSLLSGATDCVYNARDTLFRAASFGSHQKFRTIEDVVATLIPHGISAKLIGQELITGWRQLVAAQTRLGLSGWHPVDTVRFQRDFGKMWQNGIAFSGGTLLGHVSTHLEAGARPIRLDQYSTRAFKAEPGLATRAAMGTLGANEETSTEPALTQRVERYILFEWCNDVWGCPSSEYLLD